MVMDGLMGLPQTCQTALKSCLLERKDGLTTGLGRPDKRRRTWAGSRSAGAENDACRPVRSPRIQVWSRTGYGFVRMLLLCWGCCAAVGDKCGRTSVLCSMGMRGQGEARCRVDDKGRTRGRSPTIIDTSKARHGNGTSEPKG